MQKTPRHFVFNRLLLVYAALALIGLAMPGDRTEAAALTNGFDVSNATIPADDIHHGGPPKDGIPSIDEPRFLEPGEADFLSPDDRVMGLHYNGVAKAYPIRILNYHEIVNDEIEGEALVVSYCPLCGSGMVFSGNVQGEPTDFGVSGLLYNSDVLLYDRRTESLWSQILATAISGPLAGTKLDHLAASHTTWQEWLERHPGSLVLSTDTGYSRDYRSTPYRGYEDTEQVWFPVAHQDRRYHAKEQVIGLELDGVVKAYPFAELSKRETPFTDTVAGREITVYFDAENRTGRLLDQAGEEIPTVTAFWFAWAAFHPDTMVFEG